MRLKIYLYAGMLYLATCTGHAPASAQALPDSAAADSGAYRQRLLPLPTLYYTPETKLAGGMLMLWLFKTRPTARVSTLDLPVVYTQRRQLLLDPSFTVFTGRDRHCLSGGATYSRFTDYFFGIGNDRDSTVAAREQISYQTLAFQQRLLRRLGRGWFAGLHYQFHYVFDVRFADRTQYDAASVPGFGGSRTSGAGPVLTRDTRDNLLCPGSGTYIELSALFHHRRTGSTMRFNRFTIDLRRYVRAGRRLTVAGQVLAHLNTGRVPFRQMAQLGGSRLLRGYYAGRYRDRHAWAVQGEMRYFLHSRLGVALFGGVGRVAADGHEFWSRRPANGLKTSLGAGLRVGLLPREKVNLRLDAGFGRHSSGLYVSISEAF